MQPIQCPEEHEELEQAAPPGPVTIEQPRNTRRRPGGEGAALACMTVGTQEQVRVRQICVRGVERIEVRSWRQAGSIWLPGEGFCLRRDQLPALRQVLLDASWALQAGVKDRTQQSESQRERVRRLARQFASARERLNALRADDYRRPQDYRRVCTIRLAELRRAEKVLREAEAQLSEMG